MTRPTQEEVRAATERVATLETKVNDTIAAWTEAKGVLAELKAARTFPKEPGLYLLSSGHVVQLTHGRAWMHPGTNEGAARLANEAASFRKLVEENPE